MNNDKQALYTIFDLATYKKDEFDYYYQKIIFLMTYYATVEHIFISTHVKTVLLKELLEENSNRSKYFSFDYVTETILFLGVDMQISKTLSDDEIGIIYYGEKYVIN